MEGQKKRSLRHVRALRWAGLVAGLLGLLLDVIAPPAQAAPRAARESASAREHTVGHGQTLARIASRYGLTVSTLAAANGLQRSDGLRLGQVLVIPPQGVVYVGPGDTLAGLARRHATTTAELARTNRLSEAAELRIGQELLLPGYEPAARQVSAEKRWGRPARPGRVSLVREATHERRVLQLIDARGRVPDPSLQAMKRLLRPRGTRVGKLPHPRLLRLLARVSDHFGGRQLHVISGYRKAGGATRESSRHVAAQAIDFRIPGVGLEELREYCAQLDHVGVGYYPNSRFVHLDVRRTDARWTDLAGPGEAARLVKQRAAGEGADAGAAGGTEEVGDEPVSADDGQDPVDDELAAPAAAAAPLAR
jgi:uncharacterized protein YcbK (DUF882 family)